MTSVFGTYYSSNKQLLSPGFIILIWWDLFVAFYLIFDDGIKPYNGILFILSMITVYEFGVWFGSKVKPMKKKITSQVVLNFVFLKKWLIITSVIVVFPIILNFIKNGGLSRSLVSTVSENAYEYYTTESSHGLLDAINTQITSITIYGNALLGGIYFLASEKDNKKYSAVVFLPGILQTMITSGKLGFIITVFMFAIGMMLYRLRDPETVNLLSYWHIIKKYGIWIINALFLMFLSILFRFGEINDYYINATKRKFLNYAFGSVAAFNIWYNDGDKLSSLGYGRYTFTGILNTIGIVKRERGVYTQFATSSFWHTNVFTAFRGIILDYGFLGSIFFMFILGIIAGYAYNSFTKNKSYGNLIILSMSYLFALYSFIISPFIYLNLTVFIPIILMVYCYFQHNYESKHLMKSNKMK